MRRGGSGQYALVIALSLLCFVTFLPFIWVVLTAFKPNTEIYALDKQILPRHPTLTHFQKVFDRGDQLPRFFLNPLVYSSLTIAAVSLLSAMAASALCP